MTWFAWPDWAVVWLAFSSLARTLDTNTPRRYLLWLTDPAVLGHDGREGVAKKSGLHHGDEEGEKVNIMVSLSSVLFYLGL